MANKITISGTVKYEATVDNLTAVKIISLIAEINQNASKKDV